MRYERLYSEIGKLLYAVADIDRKVSPKEKTKLLEIVKGELLKSEGEKDEFGTPVGYYPQIEFEILEEEVADAETAFQSFIDYLEEYHKGIEPRIRKLCLKVAKEIADSYYGTNKKEQALIDRLKETLNGLKEIEEMEENEE